MDALKYNSRHRVTYSNFEHKDKRKWTLCNTTAGTGCPKITSSIKLGENGHIVIQQ